MEIILLLIFLVLSALFSSSETAFFVISPDDLESRKIDFYIRQLLDNIYALIALIIFANILVNSLASAQFNVILSPIFKKLKLSENTITFINTFLFVIIILFLGEFIPKMYGYKNSLKIARTTGFFFYYTSKIFSFFNFVGKLFENALKMQIKKISTEEILEDMLRIANSNYENSFFIRVLNMKKLKVKDLAKSLKEIPAIQLGEKKEKVLEIIKNENKRLFIVYQKSKQNIIGYLDGWKVLINEKEVVEKEIIEKLKFVSGEMHIIDLLIEIEKEGIDFEILGVVDEFGNFIGIIEKEELVKKFLMSEENFIKKIGKNSYEVSGNAPISLFSEILKVDIKGNFSTISGFIYSYLGNIPKEGKEFVININSKKKIKIKILKATSKKIEKLKLWVT